MNEKISIAIVFCCYNRIEKTRKCLTGLINQIISYPVALSFYICDDHSTDGTPEMISSLIPQSSIVISEGNLYWSKGMHVAMNEAIKEKHDFYLMINDDLELEPNCIQTMLESYYSKGCICAITGCTLSLDGKSPTYGGGRFINNRSIGRTTSVLPSSENKRCDLANWNCFMVPQQIIDRVGIIDGFYLHANGDFDYSLTLRENGIPIFVADRYIGKTDVNPVVGTSRDKSLPKHVRIKKYFSIKEEPIKSGYHFFTKHYGIKGIFYFIGSIVKGICKILLS